MTFSEFGCVKPIVSHCQELLVGFIPPLVLFIFLQDEFQKWGPQSTVWKAEYDSPLTKKNVMPQTTTPYLANSISNFGTTIG